MAIKAMAQAVLDANADVYRPVIMVFCSPE
jgi:hypothetical protein